MADRTRGVLSRDPLTYDVQAESAGKPWTPGAGSTFEGAYLPSPLVRPAAGDWKAGSLELTSIGTVRGLVMTGPGSANNNALAVGSWYEWVRLTDPTLGVQFVDMVGRVIVK